MTFDVTVALVSGAVTFVGVIGVGYGVMRYRMKSVNRNASAYQYQLMIETARKEKIKLLTGGNRGYLPGLDEQAAAVEEMKKSYPVEEFTEEALIELAFENRYDDGCVHISRDGKVEIFESKDTVTTLYGLDYKSFSKYKKAVRKVIKSLKGGE